jgi:hypothetical protein
MRNYSFGRIKRDPMELFRIADIFETKSNTSVKVNGFINLTTSGMGYIFGLVASKMGIGRNTLQLESRL